MARGDLHLIRFAPHRTAPLRLAAVAPPTQPPPSQLPHLPSKGRQTGGQTALRHREHRHGHRMASDRIGSAYSHEGTGKGQPSKTYPINCTSVSAQPIYPSFSTSFLFFSRPFPLHRTSPWVLPFPFLASDIPPPGLRAILRYPLTPPPSSGMA
ncbi:hypothetical protein BS50DRAFT_578765 [Corynespora cassiicola Philippines]|uniref:Uncharacterized protein n=1 Tax=Corynespora cassiicola Philippines TaxID=1448308 RepID=A0A2T2N6E1_CORCC|nr:hypothetical protein BS50DRAFT_578765 [Corynespora cassiicola Philippines]